MTEKSELKLEHNPEGDDWLRSQEGHKRELELRYTDAKKRSRKSHVVRVIRDKS